jgi:long-chain acyl-CoA synthetase
MGKYELDAYEQSLVDTGALFELETTPSGATRYRNAPTSMAAALGLFDQFSAREYLVFEDERVTYAQAKAQVVGLMGALDAAGLNAGDRVAIAMRNFPEWIYAFYAITAAGMVAVPLNAWWSADELAYGLSDSEARLAIVDDERAGMLSDLVSVPLWSRGEARGQAVSLHERIAQAASLERQPTQREGDAPAAIFYTSGTTGRPKGVILTHENLIQALFNALYLGARTMLRAGHQVGADDEQAINLVSIPLFHVTGCVAVLMPGTATGAKFILTRRFDPLEALGLIERERVTSFGGVPTVAHQILRHPERERFDLSSVKVVSYGGAPSAPELVREIGRASSLIVPGNGYGLTETAGLLTFNNGTHYQERPTSAGPPVPVAEIKVVDPFGDEVADGEPGELLARGATIFAGYWHKPTETSAAFIDGWFRTGDIAMIDADGYMYIVDRLKDLIIRGGENVATVEVEAAIFEYPGVEDVAVFGYPDEVLGERVAAAVVVRSEDVVDVNELLGFLRGRIANFKVPDVVKLRHEPLPRNAAGKLLKRDLRQEYFG